MKLTAPATAELTTNEILPVSSSIKDLGPAECAGKVWQPGVSTFLAHLRKAGFAPLTGCLWKNRF
jgi:hypothetical protein